MSDIGARLHAHVETLFPLFRSITGPGLRTTLRYIAEQGIGLEINEVSSGTPVLDWEVPKEWTPRAATIRRLSGEIVVDLANSNLHLLHYSHAVDQVISRDELDRHLYSLADQPDLIPYRTAYYAHTWGFCLPHRLRVAMTDPEYRVTIDADLASGSLSYGELAIPGTGSEAGEVLFSVHCCHPSLANDNLSSIAVAIELARALRARRERRFTYRFLFGPGTIGAITWLHFNQDAASRIVHGLVLSCLGDAGAPSYKRSRRETAPIDRYATAVLAAEGYADRIRGFEPTGYDERQFCSPGFNLPVGCLMRSANGTFPQYHTSADNLDFVRPEALAHSLGVLERIVDLIERDVTYVNTCPYGEPQLGRRGLYSLIGGQSAGGAGSSGFDQNTLLWVLNLADGTRSLLDIAERSGKPFPQVAAAAEALLEKGLLRPIVEGRTAR